MRLQILATAILLSTSLIAPIKAQEPGIGSPSIPSAQTEPTRTQIANACIQNQAEALPLPFSDVSPDHWAFKAVMTMHYCGAFREAAPPTLFQDRPTTEPISHRKPTASFLTLLNLSSN